MHGSLNVGMHRPGQTTHLIGSNTSAPLFISWQCICSILIENRKNHYFRMGLYCTHAISGEFRHSVSWPFPPYLLQMCRPELIRFLVFEVSLRSRWVEWQYMTVYTSAVVLKTLLYSTMLYSVPHAKSGFFLLVYVNKLTHVMLWDSHRSKQIQKTVASNIHRWTHADVVYCQMSTLFWLTLLVFGQSNIVGNGGIWTQLLLYPLQRN